MITTIVAAVILCAGLWVWMRLVPAASVAGAIIVSQLTLLLLLLPRFWQRGVALVTSYRIWSSRLRCSLFTPAATVVQVIEPAPAPVISVAPPEPQAL